MLIARAGADFPGERRHRLEIVVEHVGPRCHHDLERTFFAYEVWREHLDRRRRRFLADRSNRRGKLRGTTVREIVAIDRRHHHMGKPKLGYRRADALGLERIDGVGTAGAHVAEGARPGAGVAEDHHRRVPLAPALPDIWTGSLLAHGVQAMLAQGRARLVKGVDPRRPHADPTRFWLKRGVGQPLLLRMARPQWLSRGEH